ncbi:MAG TPA: hypothetical protein VMV77_01280, partial [Bacteroidales bacterium]|nr:hypothetical protein [Bacteroidales bacterium]
YNLKRIGNILTRDRLIEYLRMLISLFLSIKDLVRPGIDHSKTLFPRLTVWNNKFPGLLIPA